MPFVTGGSVLENRATAMRRVVNQPSHPLHYTFKEVAGAALDEVGLTWNAGRYLARNRSFEDDPTYVLHKDEAIKPWFEMYPEEFKHSVSAQNSMDIVGRIERGKEARRILSNSGGTGIMVSLAAGIIDPVNLIPLSWLTKAAQGTKLVEAARVATRIKYGTLVADDAVRLGVQLTPDEVGLIRGVKDTTKEVEALRRMGVRAAERQLSPIEARIESLRTTKVPDIQKEIASLRRMGANQAELVAAREAMSVARTEKAGAELLIESAATKEGELLAAEEELAGRAAHIRGIEAAGEVDIRGAEGLIKEIEASAEIKPDLEEVRRILSETEKDVAVPGEFVPLSERGTMFSPHEVKKIVAQARAAEIAKGLEATRAVAAEKVAEATKNLEEAELLLGVRRANLAEELREESGIISAGVADARRGLEKAQAEVARRRQLVLDAKKEWDTKLARHARKGEVREAKEELSAARGVLSARELKLAEAKVEGEARMQAIRTSQLAVAGRIKDHQGIVDAARKKALEGLPSPLEGAGATVAEGAALGAGFSGGSEVFLQAVQEGREDELLANSFIAGGILGGILGGAGAVIRSISIRRLNQHHEALVEELTSAPVLQRLVDDELLTPEQVRAFMVGGDVPRGTTPDGRAGAVVDSVIDKIGRRSPSMEKILRNEKSYVRRAMKAAVMSPAGRMFYSISPHAQNWSNLAIGLPYLRKGAEAVGPAAARRMEIHFQANTAFIYKLREIRGRADPVDFGNDVAAYVMSGGKTNATPEVIQAAEQWNTYHGKTLKAGDSAGVLQNPDLGVDAAYFPHYWNHDELRARKEAFIDRAAPYYNNDREFVRARLEEQLAEPLSNDPDAMNSFLSRSVAGSLQERGWKKLPGHLFLDFMHTDLDYVASRYVRTTAPQIEIARMQPNGSMLDRLNQTEWRKKIDEDYEAALAAATTDKQKARIQKEWDQTKTDFNYTLESLLGFLKRDPFNASERAISDAVTTGATLMYGGNFGWNSLGDPIGAAFVNGARPWLKVAVGRLRRTLAGIPKDEIAKEAYLYQFLGGEHSRSAMMFDFLSNSANAPKGHGGIWRRVHNGFMWANGLRFITAKAAEMNTYLAIDTLLGISRKIKNGAALTKAERQNLLLSGLDDATASRIGEKVLAGGADESHGVLLANLNAWGDDELAATFRAAVAQNTHRGVMNPGKAEMPMVMRGQLGRVLFQFLQFSKAANDNFLISGLQRHDSAVIGGALMMLGMGVFVEAVNYHAKGKEIPELDTLLADGFNRSGLIGILPQMNEWAAGMTGGIADVNHLFGTKTVVERYGGDASSMIPGFSAVDDISRQLRTTVRLLNGEEITDQQAAAYVRRIPGMNAVYMAPVREIMQEVIR